MITVLNVTDNAVKWMKEEFEPEANQGVNISVKYGGETQLKQGFSPALAVESIPDDSKIFDYDGINIFIKESDLWYFKDSELKVDVDDNDEISFAEK
ncbi:iron-sulfur cluster biosynthesis family protein [Salinicoccus albus]|uniref:HesB/YadR/YfhF family protein n=1 Tax=Salinicoccus albus TaxID=418756 RepID=UPI00037B1867